METKFQTSFIPKAPVTDGKIRRTSGFGLLFLIAFVIFIASLATAAGIYLYANVVEVSIAKGNENLADARKRFDPNQVKEFSRLDDRIDSAYGLLKKHVSLSNLLGVLSEVTLKTVRFNDFNYTHAGGDKITISMKGSAHRYETVALQAKSLTNPEMRYPNAFKSPIFDSLNVDLQNNVSFGLTTGIDPSVVSYYALVQELKKANALPVSGAAGDGTATVEAGSPTPGDNSLTNQ